MEWNLEWWYKKLWIFHITFWLHLFQGDLNFGELYYYIIENISCFLTFNTSWMKKLSLFGGNWKLLIFKICIGINDHTHKDPKNQVDMIFQLFVYILQQNKWNLLKKQVL